MWLPLESVTEQEYTASPLKPLVADEARMFSLEQLQQLSLLFFNRSTHCQRLDRNDADTRDARHRI